jgi:superoxide dismutase, Fe-Mn family
MAPLNTRREFLSLTGKAGMGLLIGSTVLSSCSLLKNTGNKKYNTGFQQKPLPYDYNDLREAIDPQTMEIHYTRHAAAYAKNLQDAANAEGVNMNNPLEDVLAKISKYSAKMRNNGGGHYNHEFFWSCMSPNNDSSPSGKLEAAINTSFGSFENFKSQFEEVAKTRFGSGWAWLIIDKNKKLRITSTPNQDNPLMDVAEVKGFPLLGLDVWEHAYYLRYQNRRADYITNWWKVVNWDYVEDRYESMA